jgi:membrane-associated protease RseP (regulator of RpoE activity)
MSADRMKDIPGETTMKHLLRPYQNHPFISLGVAIVCAAAAGLAMAPPAARAQASEFSPIFEEPSPLAIHTGPPAGYLGVGVVDVDADKAQDLKLKDVRGAVITLIDHDSPAGQVGLKVNDVVIGVDGQNVEGAEALRRMLREIPPGRKISLEISRDGNIQTMAVQLVDRKAMEHEVWSKLNVEPGPIEPSPPGGMGIIGSDAPPPSSWHMSLFTGTLNVGALVEPLTSQMADYFGVPSGLMVKQVTRKSEAASAGLKAFDVILKVGTDSIATSADWDRALRSNQGKPVQVTILRDKKQQTITLQVDSKHRSAVEFEDLFGPEDGALFAELTPFFDSNLALDYSAQAAANANALAEAAQAQSDLFSKGYDGFQLSQAQAEQLRKQAEALQQSMKNFKIDPGQMKALQQNAEQLRESMKGFQIDPKQMQQFQQQMEEFRKGFGSEQMKQWQQQMQKFGQQMQQWQKQSCADCV